jgi:hypothetical protein
MQTLMETVRTVFPDAMVEESSEGEVVVATGLMCVGDPETPLVPYVQKENV